MAGRLLPKAGCNISHESKGKSGFSLCRFEHAVELIGSMRVKLWVNTSEGDEVDLVVVLPRLDSARFHGNEVFFSGFNSYERDSVTKGWLRAHIGKWPGRAVSRSVHYSHTPIQTCVLARLFLWKSKFAPSATLVEAASTPQLTI